MYYTITKLPAFTLQALAANATRILNDLIQERWKNNGFFQNEEGWGYIVMEFIGGKVIDPLEDVSAIKKVAAMLDYLASFRSTVPGSLCGGLCRGLFWPDDEDLAFDSLEAMEKWLNSRLLAKDPKLTIRGCGLVLCHLDIARRNILWQDDGSICLIDWESAGYYPRLFEFCMRWILEGMEGNFNALLHESMGPLSDREMAQRNAIFHYWANIQRYVFRDRAREKRPPRSPRGPVPAPPRPPYPPEWLELVAREGTLSPS